MRLYDVVAAALGAPEEHKIPVIVADNIARQIDGLEEDRTWSAEEFGSVAPPFPQYFVEAITEVRLPGEPARLVRRGALISTIWGAESDRPATPQLHVPGTRWIVALDGFIQRQTASGEPGSLGGWSPLQTYGATAWLRLDERGHLMEDMESIQVTPHREMDAHVRAGRMQLLPPGGVAHHVPYAMMAVAAMRRRVPVEQFTPQRAARRRIRRELGREGTSYYVLMVRPTAPGRFRDVGSAEQSIHVDRRAHVVRGHFRYYSPERPLFGRPGAHGAIWIDQHERGVAAQGRVNKDYYVVGENDED